jgi:hypothetical protein
MEPRLFLGLGKQGCKRRGTLVPRGLARQLLGRLYLSLSILEMSRYAATGGLPRLVITEFLNKSPRPRSSFRHRLVEYASSEPTQGDCR